MKKIPQELKDLVNQTLEILGKNISQVYGKQRYQQVERLRSQMKKIRGLSPQTVKDNLKQELKKLKKFEDQELYEICHSFTIYMELINRAEKAYRHSRLKIDPKSLPKKLPYAIIYVFTAHPTEARSTETIQLFEKIEDIMIEILAHPKDEDLEQMLEYLVNLSLRIPLSKGEEPSVEDEAHHIFSTVLSSKIIDQQINLKRKGVTVNFRTWVGGDKDGHPYVQERTLLKSLQISRKIMCQYILQKLIHVRDTINLACVAEDEKKLEGLIDKLDSLEKQILDVKKLQNNDGQKIQVLQKSFDSFYQDHLKEIKSSNLDLEMIKNLLWLYPAIVLPLEVRDDSEIIRDALKSAKDLPIKKMLKTLKLISHGYDPKWYVRGLIISMTNQATDISNGITLVQKVFKKLAIPVVPLFETRSALEQSTQILKETFNLYPWLNSYHKDNWSGRYEVMLGYSDSSKESGVIASRYLIANALNDLDRFFKKEKLTPVFFHGSGGSIERGGGSVKEQTSWWPKSSLHIFKATIQGEMVARNFGDPLIMKSHIDKVLEVASHHKKIHASKELSLAIKNLADHTAIEYAELTKREDFIRLVQEATPYLYLDQLKIGSRPSQRQTQSSELKLRAIPWVLCWTQTRVLLPTWYGIGSAWENLDQNDKYRIISEYHQSEFLVSFTKILGFSLAKVELGVFQLYLEYKLPKSEAQKFISLFEKEFNKTIKFYKEVTRNDDFLWFRPWLKESIYMRSSIIHSLNLIQLIALEKENPSLLRESVTGIACGMLTTG